MNCFVCHNCANYQRVVMGVLASFQVQVKKRDGRVEPRLFGHHCISSISADLMLRRWAFRDELDSPPPTNPPEITWISSRGCWC